MKIGFVGAGQMATALAVGIANRKIDTEIYAYDPSVQALSNFENAVTSSDRAVQKCASNQAVIERCEFVFVAVKPQILRTALSTVQPGADCVFVSVVAGSKIETLAGILGSRKIIRTMPNTPCLIGKGAIAVSAADGIVQDELTTVKTMLSKVGTVVDVPERLIDAVTGLSGSGPAFVYTFVEAMIDAGVLAGLPRETARVLATQTVMGSVQMIQSTNEHPALLRDKVTSPGGTTIHGMEKLEQLGFRECVLAAVKAAAERSEQLSNE